ncbi:phage virion morphogenesis protein [Algihabitans albus]|uniref:phage virion morphogenesis protein n=1 Tax=Algihabitans albus TaxID=2164067 RepID=UPI000E5CBE35|nr:phage virion morphogenesis protein [Algihabitans albus]
MAGVSFRIDIEDLALRRALAGAVEAAEDLTAPFDEIGSYLVAETLLRFEEGRAPDGTPWIPSQRVLREGGQTLIGPGSGRLRDSQTYDLGADFVEVGTNVVYAAIHQFGGLPGMAPGPAAIPARPYLGLGPDDEAEIVEILDDHLLRGLQGGAP